MSEKQLNSESVLNALRAVLDPDLQRDVVSLGFVKDLKVDSGQVSFCIELTTPACPVKDELQRQAEQAVSALPGVESVQVKMDSRVTSKAGAASRTLIPGVKNAVAVASGKGGVGKSTVAANLATALQTFGAQVGLMDADVYGPSIPKIMGVSEQPQVTPQNRIIPPQRKGIKLISMGYFLPKDEAVIWRGPMLHKMVQDFLGLVEWGELDYLVIDLPPGTGDIQLSLCQTVPLTGAVIVSTPQDLALEVASKAIAMFRKLKTPVLGIVENMSYYTCPHCGERDDIFGHGGAESAGRELGIPFLGEIPLSPMIRERSDRGEPLAWADEADSPYARAFKDLASRVAAQVSIANFQDQPRLTIET